MTDQITPRRYADAYDKARVARAQAFQDALHWIFPKVR